MFLLVRFTIRDVRSFEGTIFEGVAESAIDGWASLGGVHFFLYDSSLPYPLCFIHLAKFACNLLGSKTIVGH